MNGLELTVGELKNEVSRVRGWGSDYTVLSLQNQASVISMVRRAMRVVYLTPINAQTGKPHQWSFLFPETKLRVWGDTTGTLSGLPEKSGEKYKITATSAVFLPTMVGHKLTTATNSSVYLITDVKNVDPDPDVQTSDTVLATPVDKKTEVSGESFTVSSDGDFDAPDDMFAVMTDMTYKANDGWRRIARTSALAIRQLRMNQPGSGNPYVFAVVSKPYDSATGQRFTFKFHWTPSSVFTLIYSYQIYPAVDLHFGEDVPEGEDSSFPIGGAVVSEALLSACRMAAESERGVSGLYSQEFRPVLQEAILADTGTLSLNLGRLTDPSTIETDFDRHIIGRPKVIYVSST